MVNDTIKLPMHVPDGTEVEVIRKAEPAPGISLTRRQAERLAINPIIYAELAPAFRSEAALQHWPLQRLPLPYEAAWPAAHAFTGYRRRGGVRTAPLPDFYIGAHADVAGLTLLTRDSASIGPTSRGCR